MKKEIKSYIDIFLVIYFFKKFIKSCILTKKLFKIYRDFIFKKVPGFFSMVRYKVNIDLNRHGRLRFPKKNYHFY